MKIAEVAGAAVAVASEAAVAAVATAVAVVAAVVVVTVAAAVVAATAADAIGTNRSFLRLSKKPTHPLASRREGVLVYRYTIKS